jgi:AraC family transcriptional regulator
MANRLSFRRENTHECATNACARAIAPYFEENPQNNSRGLAQQRPATLSVAIRLLCFAVEALSRNQDETYQYIERAIGLLKAECDRRDAAELDRSSAPKPMLRRLAPWQLNRVAGFIESNLASTIRIQDLAAVTHLSTRQFSRAFRSTIGQSPYAHIMRHRVEYAQEVMLRTDRPLSQIALDCGLADQAHLTRLFRRLVGVSPGVWRRLYGDPRQFGSKDGPYRSNRALTSSPATSHTGG